MTTRSLNGQSKKLIARGNKPSFSLTFTKLAQDFILLYISLNDLRSLEVEIMSNAAMKLRQVNLLSQD